MPIQTEGMGTTVIKRVELQWFIWIMDYKAVSISFVTKEQTVPKKASLLSINIKSSYSTQFSHKLKDNVHMPVISGNWYTFKDSLDWKHWSDFSFDGQLNLQPWELKQKLFQILVKNYNSMIVGSTV